MQSALTNKGRCRGEGVRHFPRIGGGQQGAAAFAERRLQLAIDVPFEGENLEDDASRSSLVLAVHDRLVEENNGPHLFVHLGSYGSRRSS